MRRLALLLILALLMSWVPALADVSRGDRGEEVRYLQWLLFENGWLFEEPDGIFGGHTEEAVKTYQRAKGLEPTGRADYALMEMIDHDRMALDRENFGPDYYMAYDGDFVPPFPTGPDAGSDFSNGVEYQYAPPAACQTYVLRQIVWRDTCERHLALLGREYDLTVYGGASGFNEAGTLWYDEIKAMYGEWIEEAPAERKLDVLAAWTAWNAAFADQRGAMYACFNNPDLVEEELAKLLRLYAGTLCELRNSEPPADPDMDYIDGEDEVLGDHCEYWAEDMGTDYLSPCDAHAALFSREYDWTWNGASDSVALEALASEWDQALLEMYDRWLGYCDETQAEAVKYAQADFFHALTAQAKALEPYGTADIGQLRVVQLETARLCELLNFLMLAE